MGTSAMAANPRRNSESAASGTTRAKLVNDRKARRRLSDHRKSGPKSSDLLHLRLEGKEGRRRLSEGRRRNSRNRAAMTRRERAYESAGMKRSMSRADTPGAKGAGAGFFMEVDETPLEEDQVENGVMTSEVETTGGSTWTSDMIAEASHGILSDDRNSQLRFVVVYVVAFLLAQSRCQRVMVVLTANIPSFCDGLQRCACKHDT